MRIVAVALLAAVLGLAACGDEGGVSSDESLTGRTFLSESVTGRELVPDTQIRLGFQENGLITASAGCNSLTGDATIGTERIEVDAVGGTEIGCDPERHAQDEWLADLLMAGPRYELDDDRLHLRSGEIELTLVDREVADPDRALQGTAWALDGLIDGDAVSSMPAGVDGTLRFDEGKVAMEVCNEGSAEVTVTQDQLEIGDLEATLMACDDERMAVENAVMGVLDGTITYEIEASVLTLLHPDGHGLLLRATDP